jgi:peroxiredoxin
MEVIMHSKFVRIILLVLFLSSFSFSQDGSQGAPDIIGSVDNFTLKDYSGSEYSLEDYADSEAIVILFIATRCPVSNAYNQRMASLYEDYSDKPVTFLGINSNKQEDVGEIKKHAKENGLDFIILKDLNNIIADKFNAKFTPEIFVLSPDFNVLYHGRIDDSRKEPEVESTDLRNALDEILGGKNVSVTETKAFGCSIKRVGK